MPDNNVWDQFCIRSQLTLSHQICWIINSSLSVSCNLLEPFSGGNNHIYIDTIQLQWPWR